jgi:pimeloyl-ACP methyl ester carboxylesterase
MKMASTGGGVTLNVEVRGPEDAPAVLLLHAFPLSHRMWAPQLDAFSSRYRMIAPDYRGHGESEAGDGQYTIELLVDDVLAVLNGLGLESVVACGLSMGGYVLLRALERAPERFRAVVLADTRTQSDDDQAKIGRAASIRALKTTGATPFAEQFSGKLLGRTTLEHRPEVRETVQRIIRGNSVLGMCGALLAIAARTDTAGALQGLDIPALVVVGEEDAITPPDFSRQMVAAARRAKLVLLPQAGHLSNLESPDAFNGALGSFLEEVVK